MLESKYVQGPIVIVWTPFAEWAPRWESFQHKVKNSGDVERTGEYHARFTEASAK